VKSVLIRLEGPLQAWSSQGKLRIRDTEREPTKSGVLGLVGAALGMERDDDALLAELRTLSLAVRVDRPGSLLRDYHTAGGGRFRGAKYLVHGAGDCVPSERYYLQDASFVAALGGDDALVERVATALRSPHWPLFLGRRACPPGVEPFIALAAAGAAGAARAAPRALLRQGEDVQTPLRLVVEAPPSAGGEPRYDDPLSFAHTRRSFGIRYVKTEWVTLPDAALQEVANT